MKGLSIDPERRVAWAQPGLTAGEYGAKLRPTGWPRPSATPGTVGISGLTLGGGIGYLARKYGLAVDNLLSAQVVTADGRLLTASESRAPRPLLGPARGVATSASSPRSSTACSRWGRSSAGP